MHFLRSRVPAFTGEGAEMIEFRGRSVYLRRLHAEDRPLIEDFLARIDSEDLRMRFFGGFRGFTRFHRERDFCDDGTSVFGMFFEEPTECF